MDVTMFAFISRTRNKPFILSNAAGINLRKIFACPPITPANNAAREFITILTINFGFFCAFDSILAIASNSPEIPTDIKGNEYAQNVVPTLSSSQTNPLVFQIETKDKHGRRTKTTSPKSASLQSPNILLPSECQYRQIVFIVAYHPCHVLLGIKTHTHILQQFLTKINTHLLYSFFIIQHLNIATNRVLLHGCYLASAPRRNTDLNQLLEFCPCRFIPVTNAFVKHACIIRIVQYHQLHLSFI